MDDTTPKALDPIHDIDAKTTVTWLVFWIVLLGAGLYLLLIVFGHVLQAERHSRIEDVPDVVLEQTVVAQKKILQGKPAEGVTTISIDEAIKAVAEGARPKKLTK